jgi:hypothetical protein
MFAGCGRPVDAVEKYREALVIQRSALGPRHGDVAGTLVSIGGVLSDLGRQEEAVVVLSEAADIQQEALGGWGWGLRL